MPVELTPTSLTTDTELRERVAVLELTVLDLLSHEQQERVASLELTVLDLLSRLDNP